MMEMSENLHEPVIELRLLLDELREIKNRKAGIIATLQQVEARENVIVKRLSFLACGITPGDIEEASSLKLKFHDAERFVRWNGGAMKFRNDGLNAYRLLKMVYEAGEDGIEHADLAEALRGDQCASIKTFIRSADLKLQSAGCPAKIINEGGRLWLSEIR